MSALFILAAMMALFGILGYLYGARSAFLTLIAVFVGLLIVARTGQTIITLINTFFRFGVAGLRVLTGTDTAAAIAESKNATLISPANAGLVLFLIFAGLILLAVLAGRHPRLRGGNSVLGMLIGLLSGYLLGAYLLVSWLPQLGVILPLPFGLSEPVPYGGCCAQPVGAIPGLSLGEQFVHWLQTTPESTLAIIAMIVVGLLVIISAISASRIRTRDGGRRSTESRQ